MKVLILSTYEKTGGAAIAAHRLMDALNKNGVEAKMLSRRNISWWPRGKKPQSWTSLWERFVIFLRNGMSTRNLWATDIANCGQSVMNTREFAEADVVHLHWINQGFLSLKTIDRILSSGKRVVWTMHDEWPLEAVEHYTDPKNRKESGRDVALQKQRIYSHGRITFVTCSKWLGEIARNKPLGQGQEILSIPNPIDVNLFRPVDKELVRKELNLPLDKKLILFGCQNVTDSRKGFKYLTEALEIIRASDRVELVLVGSNTEAVADMLSIKSTPFGTIRAVNKMAKLYAACDCFVTPSLQDNLPNTIMESMSCGTPCVGFNVGGIPEMIDHMQNGYVAQYKNAQDLAFGIQYVLADDNYEHLSVAAREKVEQTYSERSVALKYIEVYNS